MHKIVNGKYIECSQQEEEYVLNSWADGEARSKAKAEKKQQISDHGETVLDLLKLKLGLTDQDVVCLYEAIKQKSISALKNA